jgi:hypothetical protein
MQPSATERMPRVIRISFAVGVAEGGSKRIACPILAWISHREGCIGPGNLR